MRNLLRGSIVAILFLLVMIPAFAIGNPPTLNNDQWPQIEQDVSDSAVVRIIPNEAPIGNQHIILVTGLEANETITLQIVQVASESVVYSTVETADERGIIEIEIFTESSDDPGTYLAEVLNRNNAIIGSDEFEVLDIEIFMPDVLISPQEAEAGTIFSIDVAGAEPFVLLDVTITDESGNVVFERELRANVDGIATLSFDSSDVPEGELAVRVISDETDTIFEGTITVVSEVLPATIVIEPAETLPGDTVFVTVSGLEPETTVRIDIALDDNIIATFEETSNISGLVVFPYTVAEDTELGQYDVEIYEGETLLGREQLDVAVLPVEVDITPMIGTVGSVFLVTVNDLRPGEEVVIELLQDGNPIQTRTTNADGDGIARTTLGQRIDLEISLYTITVSRLGEIVERQTVEIAEVRPPSPQVINPDDITVTVEPTSGAIPTVYTITVEGLPADSDLTMFILRNDESVFSVSGTAGAEGIYTTEITSEASDPPGTYTAEIRVDGETVGSADFEIADDAAPDEPDDETPPITDSDVSLEIVPATLRQGERIEFYITGLAEGDMILFELFFEDEVIYTTEAIANSDGVATVALVARADEPLGDYDVEISQEDTLVAVNSFEIVPLDAEIDNAQVVVEPQAGAQGTEYSIIVTGLDAEENVAIFVMLGDEMVFEGERTATATGTVSVTLNSDQADAVGTYDVRIVRNDADALASSFDITEATDIASPEQDDDEASSSEATITINPMTGDIGTQHVVSVEGLTPDETFTLSIEFDGETVYSVERTADSSGAFSTTIAAAEDDPAGDYTVIIDRTDADDLSGILTVTDGIVESDDEQEAASSDLTIQIIPDEVNEFEPFDVVINGLEAQESVTITIDFDGETVFETERTADADGAITLNLATEEGDPTGTYTVTVTRDDETVSADVVVAALDAPQEEDEITDTDVQVTVEPSSGEIGTVYEFFVSGLGSNEEFDIAVEFDGDMVFEATRTADASGFFSITLQTSNDDDPGTYTFSVLRAGEAVASVDFEVNGTIVDEGDDEETDSDPVTMGGDDEQPDPQPTSVPVTYADAVQVTFEEETTVQVVEFEGRAGDVISINVDSGGTFDTVATLLSPSGVIVANDDDGGLGFDPEIERTVLPDNGMYQLEIRPFEAGTTGTALVTINRDDVRTLDADEVREVVLNSKVTADILVFEGVAGEVVSLVLELDEGDVSSFVVTAEQADVLLMNYQTFGLPQTVVLGFVVPEDGTVVIRLEDDGSTRSKLNAQIETE